MTELKALIGRSRELERTARKFAPGRTLDHLLALGEKELRRLASLVEAADRALDRVESRRRKRRRKAVLALAAGGVGLAVAAKAASRGSAA